MSMPAVSRRIFRNFSARLLNENRRRIAFTAKVKKPILTEEHEVVGAQHAAPKSVPWSILVADFNSTIAALNKYRVFTFAYLRGFRLYGASEVRTTASF